MNDDTEFTLTADEVRMLATMIGDHAKKMVSAADASAMRYADLAHRLETAAHRYASQDAGRVGERFTLHHAPHTTTTGD